MYWRVLVIQVPWIIFSPIAMLLGCREQYILVKNKRFLAGDRLKKRIFYSSSRKFRREVFFGTPCMYQSGNDADRVSWRKKIFVKLSNHNGLKYSRTIMCWNTAQPQCNGSIKHILEWASQCSQFFRRAHFGKKTGERRAFLDKNTGIRRAQRRAKLKFCDFVVFLWFSARSERYWSVCQTAQ